MVASKGGVGPDSESKDLLYQRYGKGEPKDLKAAGKTHHFIVGSHDLLDVQDQLDYSYCLMHLTLSQLVQLVVLDHLDYLELMDMRCYVTVTIKKH